MNLFNNLQHISLGPTAIDTSVSTTLATTASLESLNFSGTELAESDIKQLPVLPNLKPLQKYLEKFIVNFQTPFVFRVEEIIKWKNKQLSSYLKHWKYPSCELIGTLKFAKNHNSSNSLHLNSPTCTIECLLSFQRILNLKFF
jgi:hypothetical protein